MSTQRASSYGRAVDEVNAWLAVWAREGSAAAAAKYLSGDELPASGVAGSAGPDLVSGVVRSYEPSTWTSQDSFVLVVTMDLHFRSGAVEGNWNDGVNTRFLRFEKATGSAAYRMYVSTGP